MTRSIIFICDNCGSNELIFDTISSWNAHTQSWEQEGEYDHSPCCNSENCQGEETSYHTVDVQTGEQIKCWRGEWLHLEDYERKLEEHHLAHLSWQKGQKSLAIAQENATLLGEAYGPTAQSTPLK